MTHLADHTRVTRSVRTLRIIDYISLARQRRALARLDGALLRDLGINAKDARDEAARPVWDVPSHWMR